MLGSSGHNPRVLLQQLDYVQRKHALTFEQAVVVAAVARRAAACTDGVGFASVFSQVSPRKVSGFDLVTSLMNVKVYPESEPVAESESEPVKSSVKCPSCRSARGRIVMAQTRSADEGMTAIFVCDECGKSTKLRS